MKPRVFSVVHIGSIGILVAALVLQGQIVKRCTFESSNVYAQTADVIISKNYGKLDTNADQVLEEASASNKDIKSFIHRTDDRADNLTNASKYVKFKSVNSLPIANGSEKRTFADLDQNEKLVFYISQGIRLHKNVIDATTEAKDTVRRLQVLSREQPSIKIEETLKEANEVTVALEATSKKVCTSIIKAMRKAIDETTDEELKSDLKVVIEKYKKDFNLNEDE